MTTAWTLAYAVGAVFLAAFAWQVATNTEASTAERFSAVVFGTLAVLLALLAGYDLLAIWRKRGGPR